MTDSWLRHGLIALGCTGLLACSQPAQQAGDVSTAPHQHAKLCIAEGQPGGGDPNDVDHGTWSITVSSEGGPCSHVRQLGSASPAYEVARPPAHGHLTQEVQAGQTVVSYWPEQGYVGGDNFTLRAPARNVSLRYLVAIVP